MYVCMYVYLENKILNFINDNLSRGMIKSIETEALFTKQNWTMNER